MNKEEIIKEANFYLNNDLTEREAALELGISRRTLQLHLKKLGEIDVLLYDAVLKKKESNVKTGRIKGGVQGKATPSYTKEEAIAVANIMLGESLTYEEAAKRCNIPKSTIFEMLKSDFIPEKVRMQLDLLAIRNNKNKNASGKSYD